MITIILIFLMAIVNGCMDMNFNNFSTSIFSDAIKFNPKFWNPNESWVNKWKNGDKAQGEKFLGSSTVFVFLTDSWHVFKMSFLTLIFITITLHEKPLLNTWIDYIIYTIIWGITFELTRKILTKK